MDFTWIFDAEELTSVLNLIYKAGVRGDMFAIVNEENFICQVCRNDKYKN